MEQGTLFGGVIDMKIFTIDDITWGHKTPIQHIYGHGPG